MTLAIADKEGDLSVLDCIREIRLPISPKAAVYDFADLLKRYRVTKIRGEATGVARPSAKAITYQPSEDPKLILYQLVALERRTSRAGVTALTMPWRSLVKDAKKWLFLIRRSQGTNGHPHAS